MRVVPVVVHHLVRGVPVEVDLLVGLVPIEVDHLVGMVPDSSQEEGEENDNHEDLLVGVVPAEVHHLVRGSLLRLTFLWGSSLLRLTCL